MGPSPAVPPTINVQLPATLASVATARRTVARFIAELEVDVDGIVLAVSEAVANVVSHAYAEGSLGHVELSACARPFDVTVTVRDHGHGFSDSDPTAGAGYGLQIIDRLAQHVEVEDTRDGVAITMHFPRGGAWSVR